MPTSRPVPTLNAMTAAMRSAPVPWNRAALEERWSRRSLSEATRLGLVARIAPGQYAHREHAEDLECRLRAVANWMAPHGRITGRAALHLHGWRMAVPERIDVVLAREVRLARPPYVDTFRTADAVAGTEIAGIPVVTAEDATVHAWRKAAPGQRRGLLLDVLRDRVVEPQRLLERLDAATRVASRAAFVATVDLFGRGVHSALEAIAAEDVFGGPEWSTWQRQAPVDVGRLVLHPDMVHREARIAVEFDGEQFHGNDEARVRDAARDELLASAGYVTFRFTWEDVTRRPEWCREVLRTALKERT
ncbi:endonuclease domain-containing protein [Demequina sp.]|uniref:endonuclease domain-containing protein n=1 Tax=Demequina sp. TaxID=2050685 RepID=UPI003A8687F6